jgi:hypothetical protein
MGPATDTISVPGLWTFVTSRRSVVVKVKLFVAALGMLKWFVLKKDLKRKTHKNKCSKNHTQT